MDPLHGRLLYVVMLSGDASVVDAIAQQDRTEVRERKDLAGPTPQLVILGVL